jgi:3-hydroxyacyl-CoA dehydrogenase
MSFDKPIRCVALVGTGVIGASWAAQYLARGLDVVATDPAPNAEANLRKYVDEAWGQLEEIGLSPGASRDRLSFTKDSKRALASADFVQENGPERLMLVSLQSITGNSSLLEATTPVVIGANKAGTLSRCE